MDDIANDTYGHEHEKPLSTFTRTPVLRLSKVAGSAAALDSRGWGPATASQPAQPTGLQQWIHTAQKGLAGPTPKTLVLLRPSTSSLTLTPAHRTQEHPVQQHTLSDTARIQAKQTTHPKAALRGSGKNVSSTRLCTALAHPAKARHGRQHSSHRVRSVLGSCVNASWPAPPPPAGHQQLAMKCSALRMS